MKGDSDATCGHLMNVSRCLTNAMCDEGTLCTMGQIIMAIRKSSISEEWLGLHNAENICHDMSLPVNVCEDRSAITCAFMTCAPASIEEFVQLDFSSQCRSWDNMTKCTMDSLAKAGHICDKRNVTYIIDRFGQDSIQFSAKECSEEQPERCYDVNLYRNYSSFCESEISEMKEDSDPTCGHLMNVSRCLTNAMCDDGTHCTMGQIIMAIRKSSISEEWLGLHNAENVCDDMSLPVNVCEDRSAITCAFMTCAPASIEEFVQLNFSSQCRAWDNMTKCTMDSLAKAGHMCDKRNVTYIIDRFGQDSIQFSARECSEGINPCLNVSVFKNYTEYCSDTITAVREDPTCKHLQDVASCLSSTMCDVDGLYCGDDQIVKGFQDDRQTVNQWLGIPDTKGICEDEVTIGICNSSVNIECIIRKCASEPEEFEDLQDEQKCSVWSNISNCTLETLSEAGHNCSSAGVKIINDFFLNSLSFDVSLKCGD